MPKKQSDTTISLHPLSFEEAIEALSQVPKHEDSEVEESDSTTSPAPEPVRPKKRTSPRRRSSGG